MITDKLEQLKTLRAKTAQLEQQLATEQNRALAILPAQYSFESVDASVDAVRFAGGTGGGRRTARRGRTMGAATGPARPPKTPVGAKGGAAMRGGRQTRAKITDKRTELTKLVGQGKTGKEIATPLGISLPSVQNIKKALGLVGTRKK